MGKRDERRRVRQQAVLTAALEILSEEGAVGVTIAAVARRINASVGGLYRYYPTKNAIFEALQIHALDEFKRFLSGRLATSESESCWARVIIAAESWSEFRRSSPTEYRLLDESLSAFERTLGDEQAANVAERLRVVLMEIETALHRAVEAGELAPGDASVRTHLIWSAVHGLGHFEKRDHLQPEALKASALRVALYRDFHRAWST